MAKPVILLGAGASIDAGLPNANDLTAQVYEHLLAQNSEHANLFGFVVAKLNVRNARKGQSPFGKINVEEAFDALKRYLNRDQDFMGEFISSWEAPPLRRNSRPKSFAREDLIRSVRLRRGLSGDATVTLDDRKLIESLRVLLELDTPLISRPDQTLAEIIEALVALLSVKPRATGHIDKLLAGSDEYAAIATLNYDLIFERRCEAIGIQHDYGLSSWGERRAIRFKQGDLRIIKLHGSVNWYFDGADDILVSEKAIPNERALIFGGQSDKLNPNGPFLSLRNEFFRQLTATNVLAVIGYSFSDAHLNAMLRSWLTSRRNAKMIVVDPNGLEGMYPILRNHPRHSKVSQNVEFVGLDGSFKDQIAGLKAALKSAPRITRSHKNKAK